ncbi:Enoyl-[acyl-carrier-protein] reductase [NADPH] [hydrothermal vent metagenome]|uniref:Enoyl-[acyl-carrier-protein] reductase [NADPH] n=1 Tax=hydrothermal vent metagenome TaxID=652676 RepID=A0A3B1D5E7_9ZZZZ
MKFEGKSVLITGASRGIGAATALEMAREGANVAINYRSHPEEAENIASKIRALGREAILLQADVSDQSAVENMVTETAKKLGSLDHFVSNAAYSDRQPLLEIEMEGFRRTIDVTMWGAFYGLKAAAEQMNKQGNGGSIVIVSSPHAVIPFPGSMAYNMAKAAIDHMARTAASELGEQNIRVNSVHPGWTDTPGERKFFTEEQIENESKKFTLGRIGTPEEVAKGIAFTLSDDAAYMTGSLLSIEGGLGLPWWSYQ